MHWCTVNWSCVCCKIRRCRLHEAEAAGVESQIIDNYVKLPHSTGENKYTENMTSGYTGTRNMSVYFLFFKLVNGSLFMAALLSRCGHYNIFVLWFLLLSFYLFLFLAYSQPSQIGCLPYFHTRCGLTANLGCRSETCCSTRLAENTGRKKSPKICHLRIIAQLCRAMSSQHRQSENCC